MLTSSYISIPPMANHKFFVKQVNRQGIAMLSLLACSLQGYASEPETIDELGFNTVINEQLFSSSMSVESDSAVKFGRETALFESNFEIESTFSRANPFSSISPLENNLDDLASEYQSQGLKIKRLNAAWKSGAGALTVGSDWANFQDILAGESSFKTPGTMNESVASQIKWFSPNGFSIALEDSTESDFLAPSSQVVGEFEQPPSIVLSWQGGSGGMAGEYRISAMGAKIDSKDSGQNFGGTDVVGWGLNLEGGWQLGDLFAALSVTYGKGINSYILRRFGNELLVTPNDIDKMSDAYSFRPSLYYSLNDTSNFHVALGRYSAGSSADSSGLDTLDTVHMGYSWSPWPSTLFGLEVVGQNADSTTGRTEDTRVKFGAQKLF